MEKEQAKKQRGVLLRDKKRALRDKGVYKNLIRNEWLTEINGEKGTGGVGIYKNLLRNRKVISEGFMV